MSAVAAEEGGVLAPRPSVVPSPPRGEAGLIFSSAEKAAMEAIADATGLRVEEVRYHICIYQ